MDLRHFSHVLFTLDVYIHAATFSGTRLTSDGIANSITIDIHDAGVDAGDARYWVVATRNDDHRIEIRSESAATPAEA
jgi:hypothetical protein